MHLLAKENMEVEIKKVNLKINFEKGEKIHTENSYKFTYDMINKLAEKSGLNFSDCYTDEKKYYSLCAFKPL